MKLFKRIKHWCCKHQERVYIRVSEMSNNDIQVYSVECENCGKIIGANLILLAPVSILSIFITLAKIALSMLPKRQIKQQ